MSHYHRHERTASPGLLLCRCGDVSTEKPLARNTDPDTSHEAAESVRALTQTRRGILMILDRQGPLPDERIAGAYEVLAARGDLPMASPSGLRTRRAELVMLGAVADTGMRGRTAANRLTILWHITAAGQEIIAPLRLANRVG